MTNPPQLETPRLILTEHDAGMFEALANMWADTEVVRYISGKPSSPRESWMRMLQYRGLWALLGYGYWALVEKESGRYVGDIGFADFHRDVEPSIRGIPEAGWVLARWAHGRGFAAEALAAALRWLEADARLDRSVCLIDPANAASTRVAQKVGYSNAVAARLNGQASLLYFRGPTS